MDSIKFPIRFDSTGLTKLADGTADYYTQLLTIAMLTEPFTLVFTPKFGVYDPTFSSIDKNLFILNAARFVPEVEITSIESNESDDGTVAATFSFTIRETE